jgi:2,4-dienoyl-CoA reductase-like NADH-dependent reductase (Old Yellow Enzyme family)
MDVKETLLAPVQIGGLTSPNRFVVQAMECSDADAQGNPSDLTYKRYEKLFEGQWGMIDLEAITVTDECRSRLNQLEIMPRNADALKTFVGKMKSINPKTIFVFQLTHSGELSSSEFSKKVTPKPLYGYGGEQLEESDVEKIMDQFVLASQIVHDAGADGVDMKLCHGYLGSQILRPYNDRKWKYGGSWENRSRFAFELYERIQRAVNDKNFIIGSKISMWEGFPGGFGTSGPKSPIIDLGEPIALIKGLEERGAAYFIQSAGSPSITPLLTQANKQTAYFGYLHMTFAKIMRDHLKDETAVIGSNLSLFGGGKNRGFYAAEPDDIKLINFGARCIEERYMDMLALGRQSFADPSLPLKIIEGRESEIKYCTVCDNCFE